VITYREFRPTAFDARGLGLDDRQDWLVLPVSRTRDSGPLDESNFATAEKTLAEIDPDGNDHESHRFGHWGPGWFEILIVRPGSPCAKEGEAIENALDDYPALNDLDHSEREQEAANEVWSNCYRTKDRIAYIRENRSQFEFQSLADLLGCVRGRYFAGYASELIA
jgi:hypothetical protein